MVNGKAVSGTERVTRKSSFILSHLENQKPLRRAARFKPVQWIFLDCTSLQHQMPLAAVVPVAAGGF